MRNPEIGVALTQAWDWVCGAFWVALDFGWKYLLVGLFLGYFYSIYYQAKEIKKATAPNIIKEEMLMIFWTMIPLWPGYIVYGIVHLFIKAHHGLSAKMAIRKHHEIEETIDNYDKLNTLLDRFEKINPHEVAGKIILELESYIEESNVQGKDPNNLQVQEESKAWVQNIIASHIKELIDV